MALAVVSGACSAPSTTDTPVPPPLQTGPPPPPGASDIISRPFASPLSVADAERILMETEIFWFAAPTRSVQAYNLLFDQSDAKERFARIGVFARHAGQLYALCALRVIDPAEAEALGDRLSKLDERVEVIESDFVQTRSVGEAVRLIQQPDFARQLRDYKSEANRRFDKTG